MERHRHSQVLLRLHQVHRKKKKKKTRGRVRGLRKHPSWCRMSAVATERKAWSPVCILSTISNTRGEKAWNHGGSAVNSTTLRLLELGEGKSFLPSEEKEFDKWTCREPLRSPVSWKSEHSDCPVYFSEYVAISDTIMDPGRHGCNLSRTDLSDPVWLAPAICFHSLQPQKCF